jgi:hypothetical protein
MLRYEIHFSCDVFLSFIPLILYAFPRCVVSATGIAKHAGTETFACVSPTIVFLAAAFPRTLAYTPRS